jgi:hypothetical protein
MVQFKNSAGGAETDGFTSADGNGWAVAEVAFLLAPVAAGASVKRQAPGWHPGRGLPGLPGGTPFAALLPGAIIAADTGIGTAQRAMGGTRRQAPDAGTRATYT